MGHPRNVFFRLVYRERTLALRHNFCGGHRFKNHHNYSGVWFETTKNKTKQLSFLELGTIRHKMKDCICLKRFK